MLLPDGFPGQRMHVLPAPLVAEASRRPPTSMLLVTDAGYFPHAAQHGRIRRAGASQAIVIACTDGTGWCELAGRRHRVGPHQVLVIPPGVPHRYQSDPDQPWSIWWLHVRGSDLEGLLAAVGLTVQTPVATLGDPYRAFTLLESVCDDLARDETSASLTAAAGAAWHLLAQLAAERGGRSRDRQPIARAQAHLRAHLAAPVNVPALADLVGFSPSHFSARFKSVTGFSVLDYVKRLRMARSRQLLITSEHSVAEIAAAVGYRDPFYFSRQFREVNGQSPREFRRQARAEAVTTPAPE
jgi:AraC family transcriptional regulator of arabinose operon